MEYDSENAIHLFTSNLLNSLQIGTLIIDGVMLEWGSENMYVWMILDPLA